ncbi:MAG: HupE/UreJ family protein [Gemmatimonadaceae bacterium]|nr:HupE/UreJ family protein [Gemmatimonadaceae bacterium]
MHLTRPSPSPRSFVRTLVRTLAATLLASVATMAPARPLRGHEVPARVTVQLLARAEAQRLRLAVRVPLESLRDLELPLLRGEYVDIARLTPQLADAATLWIAGYLELYEGDRRLAAPRIAATHLSLPSDRSFESFDRAVANANAAPLGNNVDLPWRQAMVDLVLDYAIESPTSRFSVRPLLAHLGVSTTTVLRWVAADGRVRGYEYVGNPGLVRLDPTALQAAAQFVRLGFAHILGGLDHLLFLLCLVIPFRRLRPLVAVVTAFTAAHSLTLIASALGMAPRANWFPPLIEFLIALSIVLMAIENMLGARLEKRWLVAFGFGLVHGFGFSFALGESLQFAGRHLLASLLAFNVGVELGQLLVVAVSIPVIAWIVRSLPSERAAIVVASAIVAHEAWHWMTERFGVLRAYHVTWPVVDLALAATLVRGLMLLLLIAAVLWGVAALVARLVKSPSQPAGWTMAILACAFAASLPRAAYAQGEIRSTLKGVYTDAQAARGKDLYVGTCRECHTPASHTGIVFKNAWGGKLLADLLAFMSEKMPKNNPGSLTPEEYADVTAYILSLNGLPSGDDELPSDQVAAKRIRIETSGR